MVRDQIPNLLRLHLNPYVAQTCYCLTQLVQATWPAATADEYQVFLANSLEESLSGAIKLVRYTANATGRPGTGLILDDAGRLEHFARTELRGQGAIDYVPQVSVVSDATAACRAVVGASRPGFVVVFLSSFLSFRQSFDDKACSELRARMSTADRPFTIVCVDRTSLLEEGELARRACRNLSPDVVVFDESFVDHEVPFGAFAGSKRLYDHWNRPGMATFHSTTYQPNTISNLHFMRCLDTFGPDFIKRHSAVLERIERDLGERRDVYRRLYSPSLAKLIRTVGLDQRTLRAAGHYVTTKQGRWFDGVAGVACSVRGHNPPNYVEELDQTGDLDDCRDEVARRLHDLTGLPHVTPAVSGASAVEQALKIALAARHPRTHVLALEGGFGGKTLFALTGTWKPALRQGLAPLYPHVVYVDPFAPDAVAALEAACEQHPIGVIQYELIQAVGGIRPLPPAVRECLKRLRARHGCLLLADEVQTGMYRTGPFLRSQAWDLQPDVLTLGKGTSDMMFPFALTLHSERVQQMLDERGCTLPATLRARYGYETGYRTVLGTLRRAEAEGLAAQVAARGELFAKLLREQLGPCRAVRDVRTFGLLIGIELNTSTPLRRRLKRLLPRLSLLGMLRHRRFPVMVGFCQYEPHVLKLTPPLSIAEDEVRDVCATIADVLRMSPARLIASAAWQAARRR